MASSPYDDNAFTTANTFTNVLHSTPQQGNTATMNLQHDQSPALSNRGSDRSSDMSIEVGRGLKSNMYGNLDASPSAIFSFGNDDSQYEITATPVGRTRTALRKSDGILRKEASVRRATESARPNDILKRSINSAKKRAASDNMLKPTGEDGSPENTQPTATFQVRGSRFSRQISSAYRGLPNRFTADQGLQLGHETPRRQAAVSATVQSATYTAQSFMLPDIPDITELVSGVQKSSTPVVKRGPITRSRFASASFRPQPLPDIPVTAMRVPEEEKDIYVGIQLLQAENLQLKAVNSDALQRMEEYENKMMDLQNQLQAATDRADTALGSGEDNTMPARASMEQFKPQSQVKALKDRLDEGERKISVSEITASRITKERDALITQIGSAYFDNEELAKENEAFRASNLKLQEDNENMERLIEDLEQENEALRGQLSNSVITQKQRRTTPRQRTKFSTGGQKTADIVPTDKPGTEQSHEYTRTHGEEEVRSRKGTRTQGASRQDTSRRRRSSAHSEQAFVPDLASRIESEVQKHRDEAAGEAGTGQGLPTRGIRPPKVRQRSKSRSRSHGRTDERGGPRRHVSAPATVGVQEAEMKTEYDHAQQSQESTHRMEHDDDDVTMLSDIDEFAMAGLRRKLEAERQAKRHHKQDLASVRDEHNMTGHSISSQKVPRKSSLKDLTGRFDNGTGRLSLHSETIDDIVKATKTVRVQSPHSSQIEPEQQGLNESCDISVLSNTSRRRRRANIADGVTSAFIIPDITLQPGKSLLFELEQACIQHSAASCTICARDRSEIEIALPVPVTDREGYGDDTSATIRPAQQPAVALAIVIKNLQDEVIHLKSQREQYNRMYNQHDPALSKRRRQLVKTTIDKLTEEVEKRSDQVYKLYDVLEGQKQAAQLTGDARESKEMNEEELEETLQSLGIDPAELSGTVGRSAPVGLDAVDDLSDAYSDELPWEGLSDVESEAAIHET